jgi:hypothetical protein
MKDAHFHFVAATNGEKPFVFGNIDSIVRMQDELWQNGYGTLLFEADLSKLQFQPNVTLYEDDRFVLQTMLPGDRRILGLQLMLLKLPMGLWFITYTRYPLDVDPNQLQDKSGLYFPEGYEEPGYDYRKGGNPCRVYAFLVPNADMKYIPQHPTRIKIYRGPHFTPEEIEAYRKQIVGVCKTNPSLSYEDDSGFPFYPFLYNGWLYSAPWDRLCLNGDDYLVFMAEYDPLPGENDNDDRRTMRRNVCFVQLRLGYELLYDFIDDISDTIADKSLRNRYQRQRKALMEKLSGNLVLGNPKAHNYFERDPWGDICGTPMFFSLNMPPEVVINNFPPDVAARIILSMRETDADARRLVLLHQQEEIQGERGSSVDVDALFEEIESEMGGDDGGEGIADIFRDINQEEEV